MNNCDSESIVSNRTLRGIVDKTLRSTGDRTLRASLADKTIHSTTRPDLIVKQDCSVNIGDEITIHHVIYKIETLLSEDSGEAEVFLVDHDRKKYALKLYYPLYKSPDSHIMEKICDACGEGFLVNTLQYGQWEDPLNGLKRDFELMEYCAGGTLDQCELNNDEERLGEIALQCARLIDNLHQKQILHRDIKPANFFFKREGQKITDLRLGDFGISILTNREGKVQIDYQPRTVIYTAPEYYFTIDNRIQISYKSDFYSLGMMLLTLLSGKAYFQINEYKLIEMKRTGTLPYPTTISNRILQLLKALTDINPETRAGLPELLRWAKGEEIYHLGANDYKKSFRILFNQSKHQIATSANELGQLLYQEKILAVKYLYSGKITKWLFENRCPELAVEIEDIVENQYPIDREAGWLSACYFLNPEIPYQDMEGKLLNTAQMLANSLRKNEKYYESALINRNHSLYIFLSTHGERKISQHFALLFETEYDKRDVLRQLIFTLDASLPWIIENEEGNIVRCDTIDDILQFHFIDTPCEQSWNELISESFLQWVGIRDQFVEGRIRLAEGHDHNPWCILYYLNPKVSYTFDLNPNSMTYYFTSAEIGNYMNNMMVSYLEEKMDDDCYASEQLNMLCDLEDTRLYYYLKSKDVYTDKIEWIQYCLDIESEENIQKYGPYNWRIGVYKAIYGLGFTPYYFFPKSNRQIYELDELKTISSEEIKEELENGFLDDWLTLFFQENPNLDLSIKYTFERATISYLSFIESLNPENTEVQNYQIGKNAVEQKALELQRQIMISRRTKIVIGLALCIVTVAVFVVMQRYPFRFMTEQTWPFWVAAGIALIVSYIRYFNYFESSIKSILKGIVVFAVLILIIGLLTTYLAYCIGLLMIAALLYIGIKCYLHKGSPTDSLLLQPGFEELHLEPLHFAYRTDDEAYFDSSIADQTNDRIVNLKTATLKLLKYGIAYLLVSISVIIALVQLSTFSKRNDIERISYEPIIGTYHGMFGENRAELMILNVRNDRIQAEICVTFSNQISEKVTGTIDMQSGEFHLDDVLSNGLLDGNYSGKFEDRFKKISGTYENYKTKKQIHFQLNRSNGS